MLLHKLERSTRGLPRCCCTNWNGAHEVCPDAAAQPAHQDCTPVRDCGTSGDARLCRLAVPASRQQQDRPGRALRRPETHGCADLQCRLRGSSKTDQDVLCEVRRRTAVQTCSAGFAAAARQTRTCSVTSGDARLCRLAVCRLRGSNKTDQDVLCDARRRTAVQTCSAGFAAAARQTRTCSVMPGDARLCRLAVCRLRGSSKADQDMLYNVRRRTAVQTCSAGFAATARQTRAYTIRNR